MIRNFFLSVVLLVAAITSGCATALVRVDEPFSLEPRKAPMRQLVAPAEPLTMSTKIVVAEPLQIPKVALLRQKSFGLPVFLVETELTVINSVTVEWPVSVKAENQSVPTHTPVPSTPVELKEQIDTLLQQIAAQQDSRDESLVLANKRVGQQFVAQEIRRQAAEEVAAGALAELAAIRAEKEALEARFARLKLWQERSYVDSLQWGRMSAKLDRDYLVSRRKVGYSTIVVLILSGVLAGMRWRAYKHKPKKLSLRAVMFSVAADQTDPPQTRAKRRRPERDELAPAEPIEFDRLSA